MSRLFSVVAGESSDTFSIGGITFKAAPYTLMEYALYLALPEEDLGEKASFHAERLKRRIQGTKDDPELITGEWLLENLPLPMLKVLEHIMLYGEMPKTGETGKP